MMEPVFQTKKFSEIKHLLPEDSWAIQRDKYKPGEINDDIVAFYEGNTATGNLRLDFINTHIRLSDETHRDNIFMILITGNLKAQHIMNDETDGAIGLTVLGDLEADNIMAGGQEIYVAGNLLVHGLFWGDYNHGDLKVRGHITIKVFLATDQYHFDYQRFFNKERTDIPFLIVDEEYDDYPREVLASIFDDACLLNEAETDGEIYSFKDWLSTMEISKRLEEGAPLLKDEAAPIAGEQIPFIFESEYLTDNNMERFRTSPLFALFGSSPEEAKQLKFWRGSRYTRVMVTQQQAFSTNVYFQHLEEYAAMIFYFDYQSKRHRSIVCKSLTGEDKEWHTLDVQQTPEYYKTLIEEGWISLQQEFSAMEYYQQQFREKITVEKVTAMLSLPLVKEKYSDYYDDDSDPLYIGSLMCSFRQPEDGRAGRVTIIKSYPYKEEEEQYDFYHFDIKPAADGGQMVRLRAQDEDGYESETYNVSVTNTEKFKNALEYFGMLERKIEKIIS
ncbi:hypothetical protein UNH65_03240 [Chitinophaga sp. 180180018-2]|nr:hypothetical protein [Chitinophaga sp. 212800010-3]